MKAIAVRGGSQFLIQEDDDDGPAELADGVIYDRFAGTVSDVRLCGTWLASGYWEPVDPELAAEIEGEVLDLYADELEAAFADDAEEHAEWDESKRNRDERGRFAAGDGSGPTALPFREPPPPRGRPGGKSGGVNRHGTLTRAGDFGEVAMSLMGFKSALSGKRQGPIDLIWKDAFAVELKTCFDTATEYAVKMKSNEVEEKRAAAKKMGLPGATVIAIVDTKTKSVSAYWKDGISNGALLDRRGHLNRSWRYIGKVSLSKAEAVYERAQRRKAA